MHRWIRSNSWTALLAGIVVASVVYNLVESKGYLSVNNFVNLFELSIEKVIVVVVMTFVIVAGEIDLSVASIMVLSASVLGALHETGLAPFPLAVLIAVGAAAAAGLVHGLVVTRLGLPSLVVTLAGLIGWRGAARVLVEDRSIGGFPDWFDRIGQNELLGPLPFSILFFAAVLAAGWVILHRTEFGRYVYVIGDNAEVARYSGIAVNHIRTWLFVASGLVSGIAGVLFAARLGAVRGDLANGYELEIITVVLLGGVSIFGGSGRFSGVTLAILIVLNVRNGLGLANIDGSTQTGVIGVILIGSVLGQNAFQRIQRRRTAGVAVSAETLEPAFDAAQPGAPGNAEASPGSPGAPDETSPHREVQESR